MPPNFNGITKQVAQRATIAHLRAPNFHLGVQGQVNLLSLVQSGRTPNSYKILCMPLQVYKDQINSQFRPPGALSAVFMYGTTNHCYIVNKKAFGLVVSEKKSFLCFPFLNLWQMILWVVTNLGPGVLLAGSIKGITKHRLLFFSL